MTITIRLPSGERREFSQDRILIGRGVCCPICLPDAGHLQDEHAWLRKIADRWMVESRGDWLIRVGNESPARFGWLRTGDVIRLSQDGPELVFEPAHEDVVLAGLETPAEEAPAQLMPPPFPANVASTQAIPPPLPDQAASRTQSSPSQQQTVSDRPTPPPLPSQAASTRAEPPPLPANPVSGISPSQRPGQSQPRGPQPPPLPTGSRREK